jgi:hypothetical protein
MKTKGHFALQWLIEKTKDSTNLIGGEQKFVRLASTLEINSLQNAYMASFFGSFGDKSLSGGGKFVRNIYGNPNSA